MQKQRKHSLSAPLTTDNMVDQTNNRCRDRTSASKCPKATEDEQTGSCKYAEGGCCLLCADDHVDGDDDVEGVHPNSHKHFIPYMGFCASIWDSVRHHCHHHHHHHDHLKWTVKQQRRRPKNLWANFKRLGWMDISILRHGPALDGRQT